jgi:hypothetical protein
MTDSDEKSPQNEDKARSNLQVKTEPRDYQTSNKQIPEKQVGLK